MKTRSLFATACGRWGMWSNTKPMSQVASRKRLRHATCDLRDFGLFILSREGR